jgi:hypothetical protein
VITLLRLAIGIIIIFGAGHAAAKALRIELGRPVYEIASLWFLLGTCAVSLVVFFISLFDSSIAIVLAVVLAGLASVYSLLDLAMYLRRHRQPAGGKQDTAARPAGWRAILPLLIWTLLVAEIVMVVFATLNTQLGWDGIMNFAIKSKAIYLSGGVPLDYFSDYSRIWTHLNYPLIVPILEAWVYTFAGVLNERLVMVIFVFFFLSLVGLVYAALRRSFSPLYSMTFTLVLCLLPGLMRITASGNADIPLTCFIFGATAYSYYWIKDKRPSDLLIAGLLAALAMWCKREGMVFWMMDLVAVGGFAALGLQGNLWQRAKRVMPFAVPVLVVAPWLAFTAVRNLPDTDYLPISISNFLAHADRLPTLGVMLWEQLSSLRWSGILWFLFAAAIFARSRRKTSAGEWFLLAIVVAYLGGFTLTYTFSSWTEYTLHVFGSLDRILVHIAPTAVFFIAVRLRDIDAWLAERATARHRLPRLEFVSSPPNPEPFPRNAGPSASTSARSSTNTP